MKSNQLLHLDTNIFVYFFQQHNKYGDPAKKIIESFVSGQARAITSIITQIELLSIPAPDEEINRLQSLFLETPNLRVEHVTAQIANEAARIRRSYGFRTPDAIQLATALVHKADVFVTNDKRLSRITEIKTEYLA